MFNSKLNKSNIPQEIIDKYLDLISKISKNEYKYKIIITGTIASGKSTICDALYYILEEYNNKYKSNIALYYPEFIANDEIGLKLLQMKLLGKLSPNTFQSYILDEWKNKISKNMYKNNLITVFERIPDDSLLCFAGVDYKKGNMNDEEFYSIYKSTENLNLLTGIPTYFDKSNFARVISTTVEETLDNMYNIITCDIKNNVHTRYIGLDVTKYISKQRIDKRSRSGENYSIEDAEIYVNIYKNLYNKLENKGKISSFVEIGSIIYN